MECVLPELSADDGPPRAERDDPMNELILKAHARVCQRMFELTEEPERGDGPVDNAWLIAGGAAAAAALVAIVTAVVQTRGAAIK